MSREWGWMLGPRAEQKMARARVVQRVLGWGGGCLLLMGKGVCMFSGFSICILGVKA